MRRTGQAEIGACAVTQNNEKRRIIRPHAIVITGCGAEAVLKAAASPLCGISRTGVMVGTAYGMRMGLAGVASAREPSLCLDQLGIRRNNVMASPSRSERGGGSSAVDSSLSIEAC